MRTFQIFAIRDIKADVYLPPFFNDSIGATVRWFGDICKNAQDPYPAIARHPEDYELYHLGEWEDHHGFFDTEHDGSSRQRKQIAFGGDYKQD